MPLGRLYAFVSGKGRKLGRAQYKYEKARAQAALQGIREAIAEREEETPREQAMLKQSAFARGLGKSTIAAQDKARLSASQARRMAALQRAEALAHRGLALLRKRRRFERQMMPFEMADELLGLYGMGQGFGLWGGDSPAANKQLGAPM